MARLQRIAPLDIPQHIIQRGNNRQACFARYQDMAFYARLLHEYSNKYSDSLHAWVFMINHVHLLGRPHTDGCISNMMWSIGRRYVRYFNREYRHSRTLWEGALNQAWRKKTVKMSTPHQEYLALGDTDSIRQSVYREFFLAHVDDELIKDEIERLHNRRLSPAKMGRPRLQ